MLRNPSRVEALRRAELLDTPSEEIFDRLTRIAAKVLDAPVALFTVLDENRQFCKSVVGLPDVWLSGRDSPLSYSFCRHVVTRGSPLVVPDARKHPLVRLDPATRRGVIAYAGVPLVTSDGHALGTLCVIDFQPRSWQEREVQILSDLAAVVVTKIELRMAIKEAERAKAALHESEQRFRTAFDYAPIGMALLATDGRWIRVNQALCEILGYSREELLARTFQEITHPDDLETSLSQARRLLEGDADGYALEKRYLHRAGHPVWVQLSVTLVRDTDGRPFHFVAQIQDITGRKREEERLRSLSFRDDLTGLYNRRAFLTMAREHLKLARRQERRLLLLYADLDGLKEINDDWGHAEGDRAIGAVGDLLRSTFRESDLLARMGGDEFAVLAVLPESGQAPFLDRLRARLDALNLEPERRYPLSISVGTAVFEPDRPCHVEELIEAADARMYQNKANRRVRS